MTPRAPASAPEQPPAPCCGTPTPPGLLCVAFGTILCPGCVYETLELLLVLRETACRAQPMKPKKASPAPAAAVDV